MTAIEPGKAERGEGVPSSTGATDAGTGGGSDAEGARSVSRRAHGTDPSAGPRVDAVPLRCRTVVVPALAAAVAGLAAFGLFIAVYFTLVTYRVQPPDARWVPRICRMDGDTCFAVLDSDEARVLGVPNCVVGLGWYGASLAAGVVGGVTGTLPLCPTFVLAGVVSVAVSVYLAWALLFRLETHCKLCYTSHLLNVGLLAAFVWGCFGGAV